MFGGNVCAPLVIWAIVNRGSEQAAQHSQSLQSTFAHIPGLKVVMPATPYDAKGLLISAVKDNNPVVFIDDRWLYNDLGEVPEEIYSVPIGKGIIRREGSQATIIANSWLVAEALKAAEALNNDGISAEVIDIRSVKPLDEDIILRSVRKTGRVIIADGGWKTCGFSAELAAIVAEKAFHSLRCPIIRVTLPDAPAPASGPLENVYYPRAANIISAVKNAVLNTPDGTN